MEADLLLQTRCKSDIANHMSRASPLDGMKLQIEAFKREYPDACHRAVGPCATFNCHGLTFGSRRTWIGTSEIQKILDEDEYVQIEYAEVMPGDIAIYRSEDGSVDHSGIVVEQQNGLRQPRILSKWALCHEVVHLPFECPYSDMQITYYRIKDDDL